MTVKMNVRVFSVKKSSYPAGVESMTFLKPRYHTQSLNLTRNTKFIQISVSIE